MLPYHWFPSSPSFSHLLPPPPSTLPLLPPSLSPLFTHCWSYMLSEPHSSATPSPSLSLPLPSPYPPSSSPFLPPATSSSTLSPLIPPPPPSLPRSHFWSCLLRVSHWCGSSLLWSLTLPLLQTHGREAPEPHTPERTAVGHCSLPV